MARAVQVLLASQRNLRSQGTDAVHQLGDIDVVAGDDPRRVEQQVAGAQPQQGAGVEGGQRERRLGLALRERR